jgi:hypothetical protein
MSFNVAQAVFNQADTNQDGGIDQNEFSQFVSGGLSGGYGGAGYGLGAGGSSGYQSGVSYGSSGYGAGAVGGGYESASYESSTGYGGGVGLGVGGGLSVGGGLGVGLAGGQSYESSSSAFSSQTAVQTYPTDAQGLYLDANPQIIRRPAAGGVQTYTQNIKVRFLQPPPVPPPGVSYFALIFLFS